MVAFSVVEKRIFSFVKKRNTRIKIIIRALLNVAFDGFRARRFELDQVADSVLAPVTETLASEARFAAAELHAILNSIFEKSLCKFKIAFFIHAQNRKELYSFLYICETKNER